MGEGGFSAHGEVWHVVLGEEVRRGSRARFPFFRDGFPEGKRSTNAVFASRETDSAAPGPGRIGSQEAVLGGSSPDVGGGAGGHCPVLYRSSYTKRNAEASINIKEAAHPTQDRAQRAL